MKVRSVHPSVHICFSVLALTAALIACATPSASTSAPATGAVTDTEEASQGKAQTPAIQTPTAINTARPGKTETPQAPTRPVPTPTILYDTRTKHAWNGFPSIVIVSKPGDARIAEVLNAVQFWNDQLQAIGTPFRLGTVTEETDINPDDLVPAKYRTTDSTGGGEPSTDNMPAALASIHADIIITLSSYDLTSRNIFDQNAWQNGKTGTDLILIRNFPANITSQNATGALMHELGHAIGLAHDSYVTSVMCGGIWMPTCRQRAIVLDSDKAYILSLYPPTWTPKP